MGGYLVEIDLRKLLKADFGIDFPISGGIGNSRDDPIIIHRAIPNAYVGTEYAILRCLGMGRRIEWKIVKQTFFDHNGRALDQLKIETKELTEEEIITGIENYYFDITECLDREEG
jgi:hypothetical protein